MEENDPVFCKVDSEPQSPDRFSRDFTRAGGPLRAAEAVAPRPRHTWVTLARKAGVSPKVVQEGLGHSTIGITLDTYSHVTAGMRADVAATVAALMRSSVPDS